MAIEAVFIVAEIFRSASFGVQGQIASQRQDNQQDSLQG
jgi:hypothetical protein